MWIVSLTSLDLNQDILVFPHEASFEKVRRMIAHLFIYFSHCNLRILVIQVQQSSGRVYLLNFKQDDRKYFFWMQVNQY